MNKYKDDYEIVSTTDKKGREKRALSYRGTYYEFPLDEYAMIHFKKQALLMLITIIILQISSGFVKNQGMYQFYISLPYVFAFLALWYMASGTLRLPTKKRKYRRDEIELSLERMKIASKALMILLVIGELGELIFISLVSISGKSLPEYLYLALNTISIALLYFFVRSQRKIITQPCSKEAPPKDTQIRKS